MSRIKISAYQQYTNFGNYAIIHSDPRKTDHNKGKMYNSHPTSELTCSVYPVINRKFQIFTDMTMGDI